MMYSVCPAKRVDIASAVNGSMTTTGSDPISTLSPPSKSSHTIWSRGGLKVLPGWRLTRTL